MTIEVLGETGSTLKLSVSPEAKTLTLKNFLKLQEEEILKFRWIESEKAKKDLTGSAEIEWINRYAESFRKYAEDTYGIIK